MAMNNELSPQLKAVAIGTRAATATVPALCVSRPTIIKSVKLLNGADLAQDDTNYLVVTLQKGATVLATISTKLTGGTGPLVANTALAASLAADIALDAGDTLKVVATKNGTGVPTDALLQLEMYAK